MFVQNQISHLANHKDVIMAEIDKAEKMLFVVAYVRESGVDTILDKIKGKSAKLLCSLDMGITQLSSIQKLLENNVEVKVYKSNEGTFHPKIWLFGLNKHWKMLIGSANLTRAALVDNVEASVLVDEQTTTTNALMFFDYLWSSENSSTISIGEVISLQAKIKERKKFQNKPKITQNERDDEKIAVLFEFVKSWIDIPKYDSKGISRVWRGWYIIPDHGYVNDRLVRNLASYLPFIDGGILVSNDSDDKKCHSLLQMFKDNSNFKKAILKTAMRDLFVKQAKNYLLKFNWCYHPVKANGKLDKKRLYLTDLGKQINQCNNLECVKNLYTRYFFKFSFNGLLVVPFTQKLLQRLDYLTLEEFNYFVVHSYNNDDLETIIDLIKIYRSLKDKNNFKIQFRDYFNKIKGTTGKSVYTNYRKKVKHTINAIGWCSGFYLDDDLTLSLDDAN